MAIKISAAKEDVLSNRPGSSGLFIGIVFVLLLVGILGLFLWVSELSKATNNSSSNIETRVEVLEEQLKLADSTSTEFLSDINSQLQFLDKEIRKLWDLSNKRNKVNISNLTKKVEQHDNSLKEISATQTNDQKNIKLIADEFKDIKNLFKELTKTIQSNDEILSKINQLNNNILLLEESIQAYDLYRIQTNETLQEIQLQLTTLDQMNSANN
jgi:DNA repair exonuclease SbcCD ATPase subunit|tara:strand:+ start:316 stop:954 length:639 start_codon:yes stop_codon:yes gene_type:complete